MTLETNKLIAVANSSRGSGASVYSYLSEDNIEAAGYFNDIAARFEVGDQIHQTILTAGVPTGYGVYVVTDITDGVVTVSDFA